ncbi:ABC transporter substrate-binding protein [Herbaspirillum sp. WKF16]|uniref:ABC transporter substrate-binding protein n=1 Tax=Herbaspirillum sp. WKF16 TaxID=3028312 RepID=UPI0023A9944C|nr:ABC transporter substrate-binding protein [Herbaspirillum sp. WKF16]WDZ96755.1 ABC transporter substrate-binding protein [Herbaspirillum sp. WKF16]
MHDPTMKSAGRRSLLATMAIAAAGTLLPSKQVLAHGDDGSHTHDIAPVSADILTVVGPWEMTGLDPSRAGYMFARMEVVETLLEVDDKGQLQPGLASSWQAGPDGLQWRFTLRSGRSYHDGTPVTATSVLACLKRAHARPGVLRLADIKAITLAEHDIVVNLGRPFNALPYLLTHYSTQILAPSSFAADGKVERIVGSGPFRISSLSLPQQFNVERFDGYDETGNRAARRIQRARYISVARSETRTLLVQSGQADLAFSLDPPSIRALQNSDKAVLLSAMLPRTTFIKLNAGHPFLSDLRVRRAIALCVERQGIARALLRDPDLGATQLFPPSMASWHDAALPALRTDPDEARRLLDAAGWRLAGDGIRRRHGERFELSLTTFVDRPELPLIAAALQEEMRQIGIAVRVVIGNSSDIPAGHRSGTLQMGLVARNFGNLPDPAATLLQDFGPEGGDWGAMGWRNEELLQVLQRLSSSQRADTLAGQAGRAKVAAILQAELPVIPVVWYRQTCAVSRRMAGASIDPFERSYRISQLRWI